MKHGAGRDRSSTAATQLREGLIAIQCGAFHLSVGGRKTYFNTTPLGRAVTATAIVRAMKHDSVHVFGDGSTHRGNDIQRFYRYGILVDPALRIYKPWLDSSLRQRAFGGRTEMSKFLESRRAAVLDEHREGVLDRLERARGDARGEGARAARSARMHLVAPIMGVAHWKPETRVDAETITVTFEAGVPVALNGKRFSPTSSQLFLEANAHRRPSRPGHV
jgi:argininosuccinate synthase